MDQAPIIVQQVSKSFEVAGQEQAVLADCTYRFDAGRVHLLLGPSGSGKTTLLTIVAGFQRPSSGRVLLFGKGVEDYRRAELQRLRAARMTFVFQSFLLIDSMTVSANVLFPSRFAAADRSAIGIRLASVLDQLGIAGRRDSPAGQLSHGEKQRAVIARALVYRSEIVIADEPTASIDYEQALFVMGRLRSLAVEQGSCVLVASHDARLSEYADAVLRLDGGHLH